MPLNTADEQFISRSSRYRLSRAHGGRPRRRRRRRRAFKGRVGETQTMIATRYAVHVAHVHQRGRFARWSRTCVQNLSLSLCPRLAPFSPLVITYRRLPLLYARIRVARMCGESAVADYICHRESGVRRTQPVGLASPCGYVPPFSREIAEIAAFTRYPVRFANSAAEKHRRKFRVEAFFKTSVFLHA